MKPDLRVAPDAERMAERAAAAILRTARGAIARRGRVTLVLSGGETPKPVYRVLAAASGFDWARAELFFGDERAVAPDDRASNFRAVQETLLATPGAQAARVHRMPADRPDLDAAAREYEALLRTRLAPAGRFDIVLLGLGQDGHTASLFPGHAALFERRRWVVATPAPQIAPRLTLTYAALARARHVFFLVTGAAKAAILQEVIGGPHDTRLRPAQGVRPRDGRVIWFADRDAAPA